MKKASLTPIVAALGAAFAVTLSASPLVNAAENPFSMYELGSGYMVAGSEGTCGASKEGSAAKGEEGTCGASKEGSAAKGEEGTCGASKEGSATKVSEGKCGEGKCGANKKK